MSEQERTFPPKRFFLRLIDAPPIEREGEDPLAERKFFLVGSSNQFSKQLQNLLAQKKTKIVSFLDLSTIRSSEQLIRALPQEKLDGLIFLEPQLHEKTKHKQVTEYCFLLFKHLSFNPEPYILTVILSSACFGWKQPLTDPIIGSLTGLTKAFTREISPGIIKVLACSKPEYILTELYSGDGAVEVSYTPEGRRQILITQEAPPLEEHQLVEPLTIPRPTDLFIIAGGISRVNYELVRTIAERYHCKLALFDRVILPPNIRELATSNSKELDYYKEEMVLELQRQGKKTTPQNIDKFWSKILHAITIQQIMDELSALGSEVRYYSVDISNPLVMERTIERVTKDFGREISGIVYGMGLTESSSSIQEKTFEEFSRFYNDRVQGLDALLSNVLLEHLRFLFCFSSVAGRYGHGGHAACSASDDYLSKYCWQLHQRDIRAISFCWDKWLGVESTRPLLTKKPKTDQETVQKIKTWIEICFDELEAIQEPEIIIAYRLGKKLLSPLVAASINRKKFPLIGKIKRNFDGSIVSERILSQEKDCYLQDHHFNDEALFPGVMGLELFAELAKLAFPGKTIVRFENIEFRSAIRLKDEQIRTIKTQIDYAEHQSEVVLSSYIIRNGKKTQRLKHRFKATIVFGRPLPKSDRSPSLKRSPLIDQEFVYQILPHGPLFQVIKEVNSIDNEAIAIGQYNKNDHFSWKHEGFVISPLVIESGFQTMGLMDFIKNTRVGLPYKINQLIFHETKGKPYYIRGRKTADYQKGSQFTFEILTKRGDVLLEAIDYRTVEVDLGDVTSIVERIRSYQIQRLFQRPRKAWIEVVSLKLLQDKLKREPEYLETFLNAEELATLDSLTKKKEREQWLARVFAMKRALRVMLSTANMREFQVDYDARGPYYLKKGKKIYLIVVEENGYYVVGAGFKRKIGLTLKNQQQKHLPVVDDLLSAEEKELILQQTEENMEELLLQVLVAKEAAVKAVTSEGTIDLSHARIVNYQPKNRIKLCINLSSLPKKVLNQLVKDKKITTDQPTITLVVTVAQNEDFLVGVSLLTADGFLRKIRSLLPI
ncbi:MAG: KR domain-containing protein [Candidatus Heimdallarchaeota archaeon]|nr:KR domain-containing protein [Candidatus Heimdallarchaeota archaeon]